MLRMQPFFIFKKKNQLLEVWSEVKTNMNFNIHPYPTNYTLTEEEISNVEKLMQRDFKTALLHRRSENKGIAMLADDIITQKG